MFGQGDGALISGGNVIRVGAKPVLDGHFD